MGQFRSPNYGCGKLTMFAVLEYIYKRKRTYGSTVSTSLWLFYPLS
jgi:hypothetical protein